jgi:hypothetical protein
VSGCLEGLDGDAPAVRTPLSVSTRSGSIIVHGFGLVTDAAAVSAASRQPSRVMAKRASGLSFHSRCAPVCMKRV